MIPAIVDGIVSDTCNVKSEKQRSLMTLYFKALKTATCQLLRPFAVCLTPLSPWRSSGESVFCHLDSMFVALQGSGCVNLRQQTACLRLDLRAFLRLRVWFGTRANSVLRASGIKSLEETEGISADKMYSLTSSVSLYPLWILLYAP